MSKQEFLFLSQEEVVEFGGADIAATVKDVDRATSLLYRDLAIEATTATLFWDLPLEDLRRRVGYAGTKRVNIHAAFLDDDGVRKVGVKNIPSNPENPAKGRGPRASGLLTMLDPESGYPIALMDAAVISCIRTGALGALGAKYLRRSGPCRLGLIGTGPINRAALDATVEVCGADLVDCLVYDLDGARAAAYAKRIVAKHGLAARAVDSAEAAVRDCDIVMPATTLTDPSQAYIPYDWLKPGALFVDLSIWDATYEVFARADKLYANSAQSLERKNLTPGCLVDQGVVPADRVLDLGGVLTGEVAGRDDDGQIIVYFARGMAIYDAICGHRVYQMALAKKSGQFLTLWDEPYQY
ncbi:ornithine cyclodeaminase [Tistlia consotensis]|uniref:Ornithine cyclodeaminase n=1 Tax=Tistlia consotensis USBA 355 TaxID=560819 RepID=A0A1Y6BZ11_9PROT|nr:ornithine cyclodeaminase family protein [Tistlia consotensis]SMF36798.1 ornithine cyclodeaminase [Tistlia consotensis USBA 355]SNR72112.1 ornithine cyclodeaminase [Tistlia consotensis]